MKKNTKKVATMLLVAVVAVGSYFVSGTYAKYASEVNGEGKASVAKWAWKAGDTAINLTEKKFTFNLFETIKEADTTSAEENVATAKIAPGTGGTVTVALKNDSEVDAKYSVNFEVTDAGVPLEFSADGSTWKTVAEIDDLNITATDIARGTSANVTLKWRWAFGTSDDVDDTTNAADTTLGIAAANGTIEPTVTAKVKLIQVD